MTIMSEQRSWYLIQTKPRMEKSAEENLNRQGYETYLPMVKSQRRRNSRYINVIEAFFPRYLFIYMNTQTDNWAPIRSTLGVSHLIQFGGILAIAPDQLIKILKTNENELGLQETVKKEMNAGDKINIIDGPFAGQHGIYQQKKGVDRVSVLLDVIGKNTCVTLSMHELQIADCI